MNVLLHSTYGKSSMASLFIHSLLIAAFLTMPPAAPAGRVRHFTEMEILPVPPAPEPLVTPSQPEVQMEKTELPFRQEAARPAAQNQPLSPGPATAGEGEGEAEPAPQAEALPGEAGMPNSVALRSGKGTGIPRVTGIPHVRASKAGGGGGGGGYAMAMAVYAPKPTYPEAAKKDGWEGTVVLRIRINADGSVTVLSVLESERDDARDAAVQIVSTWQYSPVRNDSGVAVSSVRNIRVNFNLKDAV